jgi:hypothetical protein
MRHPLPSSLTRGVPLVLLWAALSITSLAQVPVDFDLRALAHESARQNVRLASGSLSQPATRGASFTSDTDEDLQQHSTESLSGTSWDIMIHPTPEPEKNQRFTWAPATYQSLLYTGTMHAFNLLTQPGTRDTMTGPWVRHYFESVSELRGWSDGDRFVSPYIGHTLEGGIFGYIYRQNSPKYRNVQWGDGREYYVGLLKAMAYSAVWHTQWKIGPASEASIGNVMLHASPGFITLTDTPTLGMIDVIAEDAADRYLIIGLENRTANPVILMLARCFLNPSRAFANVMAFRKPWTRPTRLGLFGDAYRLRKELVADYKKTGEKGYIYIKPDKSESFSQTYPKEASIELLAFPLYETFLGGGSCVGAGGSGAARINPQWQALAEVSGCLIMHQPTANQSADSLYYGGGTRWTPLAAHKISPYVQVMFGGKKVTHETDDIDLRKKLLDEWGDGGGSLAHYPKRSDWSVEVANNGPALGVGGGFDVVIARPFAWRLLNVEYTHTWIGSVGLIQPQNALRISTGAVLRIGTW